MKTKIVVNRSDLSGAVMCANYNKCALCSLLFSPHRENSEEAAKTEVSGEEPPPATAEDSADKQEEDET